MLTPLGAGRRAIMPIRGINYDTGINLESKRLSRQGWHAESVKRDMRVIARELHCTDVTLLGTKLDRVQEAAEYALQEGLNVWIQPRLIEGKKAEVLEHLAEAAKIAEVLRQKHEGRVNLNIGCELSLFMKGILPGWHYTIRMFGLMVYWMIMPIFNIRLNNHLARACQVARTHFKGPLIYSAGEWEGVNWDPFDYVGVDYYKESSNAAGYTKGLHKFKSYGKPFIITEFGCCSFKGADKKGGGGFMAVNWFKNPPTVRPGYHRDEQVQADYIEDLIRLYKAERIDGAFLYAFSEPQNIHTNEPRTDLDMASYGIVKITLVSTASATEQWEPKAAFKRVAALYGDT